jgi:hypothetical protein
VISKTHKLIYNALGELTYWPVDFAKEELWQELVQMHKDGKLDAKTEKLYFAPSRPMFELYDLEKDPNEFTNLAGNKDAARVEGELKAAMQEWMILQRDYLPLPVPPKKSGKRNAE